LIEPDTHEETEKPVAVVGRIKKDWIRKFKYRNLADWNWV
jgi:hypothetical protein